MNQRSELLDWLAALPAMETPEDRRALLARTGPASLFLYLDWQGSSHAFAERLLATLSKGGRAALSAFLSGLQSLPWLRDDARRGQELDALQSRLEALDDTDFVDVFPPGDPDAAAQEGAADAGMLAAALAGDVLLPYYVVGDSGLRDEVGEPAALLAGRVARTVEAALHGDPAVALLLDDLRYFPEENHAELLASLKELLAGDPGLARGLAGLLAGGQEGPGESALWPLIALRRRIIASVSQEVQSAAEPPDESLSWDLPATVEEEPAAGDAPGPEHPRATGAREAPPPPVEPAARPRRPFESLEGAEPGDVGVDQDVETVQPGGTVTGAVIGGSGPVHVGGQHHHGDEIDTGGGSYVGGDVDVGRDLIGRDQVVHGDQVAGAKYEAGTINIYHGTPDAGLLARPSTLVSPLIEEAIRLDVAAPPAATLDLPFDLAVAVRQPDAPTLAVEDLTQVKSQDGTVFRREEEEIVLYRVAVAAASCDVQPPHYILKLRPRGNSAPCWFQLTPHRPGKQSIVVTAYQQDDALAAQTRLSIEVQVPVSPGGSALRADAGP